MVRFETSTQITILHKFQFMRLSSPIYLYINKNGRRLYVTNRLENGSKDFNNFSIVRMVKGCDVFVWTKIIEKVVKK